MKTVIIGKQVWMQEYLNIDCYKNGDLLFEVQDPEEWKNLDRGAWCYYNNDPENGKKYGKLYNWYAVHDPRGLAPKSWQIPTLAKFEILKDAVIQNGNSLKAQGQGKGRGAGTNRSGFSALMAGYRIYDGEFSGLNHAAVFWSATEYGNNEASIMNIYSNGDGIFLFENKKELGFSVRCVMD